MVLLLKLPPIAADLAIAALLYWAGRRWFGDRTGLVAAALYLFIPVTWYDSAIWGQVEAVGTLAMLAALVLLMAFAFYALPTRVHERYLFPFFAPAALLAAGGIGTAAAYVGVGFLNAVNIHAVLAAPLEMAGGLARGLGPGGAPSRAGGLGPGALGPGGPPTGSGPGLRTTVESVVLPLADAARSELAVTLAALGQTAALVALLAGWFVVVLRPAAAASRRSPEQGHAWRASSLHLDEEGPIAEPLGVCSQRLDDL